MHNNFDPLVGKSWHNISRSDILHFQVKMNTNNKERKKRVAGKLKRIKLLYSHIVQGASAVLGKNFNLIETLLNVFPDISGLDQPKTSRMHFCFVLFCFVLFCFVLFYFILVCYIGKQH